MHFSQHLLPPGAHICRKLGLGVELGLNPGILTGCKGPKVQLNSCAKCLSPSFICKAKREMFKTSNRKGRKQLLRHVLRVGP